MNVKKFTANTSREALRLLREALGADAVILSNRNVDGQVEILAIDDSAIHALTPQTASTVAAAKSPTPNAIPDTPRITPPYAAPVRAAIRMPEPVLAAAPKSSEMSDMMSEIRSMRSMLEAQLAELSWSQTQQRQPHKSEVLKEMLATGLSASLSRFLVAKLPDDQTAAAGIEWVKAILARNLSAIDNENEILEKGGVYALVGPTGVGKTTTTAKLAARCVMRHGPSQLALITTDGYRIGGYEQLRIYGKILGVMVHAVKDESDLRIALSELKNKHTVLIDTVGVSQRDKMVTDQVAMLSGANTEVKRLLCLNATSTGETLSEVVRAYQGSGLAGCILTKLDEAATIGGVLDIAIRQKLTLYYVASGQRVPEDLHVANKQYLVDRAFKLKRETAAFRYLDEELPLLIAGAARAGQSLVREVSLG
ncbi:MULTISPECIES: flagellar biosynthesis protein FlhF [unclassified Undibacterium]|uniref:flagellar biosynthesis protein FlhF n=1 Tax=unclassified Undibacterium TaxID=2630295 RepID=UPI002AC8FAAC|nr:MULTISPECIES: flagellar biosynthesis protein FlhF [unclassified Undibacterium]MEB0138796.1 flagellar biosynthesis protein FlhF [Undibacterium sp. CCC2.1]MEB0170728.1 flagellar biosynthesis protein FlhF [Undibacterium sp. CCC1.1]MEB0174617.1 flagellar biosynthesis protein FlhF [Undibacterium sp. CCC3.4]MEB0213814.1 flagellar biosynthesis protein FlhF [Undibacterium sp. 5I2]WPX42541.1 flagellar biosynthesis protein FlhF [Undibacterium sp. CCC3.4]